MSQQQKRQDGCGCLIEALLDSQSATTYRRYDSDGSGGHSENRSP